MKTMITGIRPTGTITLANYIGGIKKFIEQQKEYKSLIFIADIHGLTTYIEPKEIRNNILDIIALYLRDMCREKEENFGCRLSERTGTYMHLPGWRLRERLGENSKPYWFPQRMRRMRVSKSHCRRQGRWRSI